MHDFTDMIYWYDYDIDQTTDINCFWYMYMYMTDYLSGFHSLSGVSYNSPNFSNLSDSIENLIAV